MFHLVFLPAKFLFHDILELYDLDLRAAGDEHGCNQFHFLPRFVRELPDHGKEVLSMCYVMRYLLEVDQDLIPPEEIKNLVDLPDSEWQNFADRVKGSIISVSYMLHLHKEISEAGCMILCRHDSHISGQEAKFIAC